MTCCEVEHIIKKMNNSADGYDDLPSHLHTQARVQPIGWTQDTNI